MSAIRRRLHAGVWPTAIPIATCVLWMSAARAHAQDAEGVARTDTTVVVQVDYVPAPRFDASPALPEDHWAVRAAARAEALGLSLDYFPAQRAVPRHVVARALESAARRVEGRGALGELAAGWWARFLGEFPEYAGDRHAGLVRLGGYGAAGVKGVEGRLSPRYGLVTEGYPLDPQPLPDRTLPFADLLLAGSAGRHLAAAAEGEATTRAFSVPRWEVVAGTGPVALSVGEAPVVYAWGRGGSFIFADPRPLPRVELQTTAPVRLPLRLLGSLSAHAFVSRLDEPRHQGDPWMWGTRVALRPHGRLTLGLARGAMFGGNVSPITADRLVKSFFGVLRQHFDNQILSADVRWRVPTEAWVPLLFYGEWAADDGAGAADEQPAILAGVSVPAVPGAPALSLGAEYADVAECCGHGSWYVHSEFVGEWARRGKPLGHPLGGGGREARLYADADLLRGALSVSADVFSRKREADLPGTPGNLFSPTRAGTSHGGRGAVSWRFRPQAELRLEGAREQGSAWHEQSFNTSLRLLF